MRTPDTDIVEVFRKAEEEDEMAELSEDKVWRLILYDCERGGVTVPELLEIRKTAIWPKGKCNLWSDDADLLLEMLSEDFINARLS